MCTNPDPVIFIIDLQDANKKLIFKKVFSAYYFLNVHLHHCSNIKSHKKVTKQKESRFFLLFLLYERRIRIRIRISDLWIRAGSRRLKNIRTHFRTLRCMCQILRESSESISAKLVLCISGKLVLCSTF